jgi:hypothetical protein
MFYVCIVRFNMMKNLKKFLVLGELNKALGRHERYELLLKYF